MQVYKIRVHNFISAFMLKILLYVLPLRKVAIVKIFLSFLCATIYFLICHILCINKLWSIEKYFLLSPTRPNFLREALVEQGCNQEQLALTFHIPLGIYLHKNLIKNSPSKRTDWNKLLQEPIIQPNGVEQLQSTGQQMLTLHENVLNKSLQRGNKSTAGVFQRGTGTTQDAKPLQWTSQWCFLLPSALH